MSIAVKNVSEFQIFLKNSKLLSKYNLDRLGVFGSFARKDSNFHDIDILVEKDIDFQSALSLKEELESNLNLKVDLVLKKYANPIILHRANKEMIYVKE
ncbi:nucleotidyltransferase family protein [Leptospira bouyouniensis]|uniref:Nucleotidyltransferase domain-containing protein n=1 Tax=Leptospira bouyouniensis TaxID=2484911 RepID=A0ABY2L4D1_9LEPT|nr:nucleotidyltransferase domain-containing protein [Leptospira bouyouniensis]TGK48880.1 nucleotidyltransferase domain-containing protein [Leptospira bouyouniensis]